MAGDGEAPQGQPLSVARVGGSHEDPTDPPGTRPPLLHPALRGRAVSRARSVLYAPGPGSRQRAVRIRSQPRGIRGHRCAPPGSSKGLRACCTGPALLAPTRVSGKGRCPSGTLLLSLEQHTLNIPTHPTPHPMPVRVCGGQACPPPRPDSLLHPALLNFHWPACDGDPNSAGRLLPRNP